MKYIEKKYCKHIEGLEDVNKNARHFPGEFIMSAETSFRESLDDIVEIALNDRNFKIIMIAGPSASGKTTTSKILCEEFQKEGVGSLLISLDNFFKGRGQAPLLPNGRFDYEAVEALNVEQMQGCLLSLMEKGFSDMPKFDFTTGQQIENFRRVTIGSGDIVIVEGIHALNPIVKSNLPADRLLNVYISVKQGVKDGEKTVLTHEDIRLIRRTVRDYKFRSNGPEGTMEMWEQVVKGEKKYIQPFKRSADVTINSIHMYEPCVFGQMLNPILKTVPEASEYYEKCVYLYDALSKFEQIPVERVPDSSLLREFLGGSKYY